MAGRQQPSFDFTRGIDQKAKDKEAEIPAELEQQIDEAFEEGDQTQDGDTRPDDGEGVIPNVATVEGIEQEYQNQLEKGTAQAKNGKRYGPGMVEDRAAVLQRIELEERPAGKTCCQSVAGSHKRKRQTPNQAPPNSLKHLKGKHQACRTQLR